MLKKIKTYLEYGNRFCGVEHTVHHGENIIYATVLKKSKNTVDIESFFEEKSIENTIAKLPKKQHVFLVINNDNILTKQIENQQTELAKLVYNAFPNINLEEFVYEVISQGNNHFVSICRKIYVEELITKYKGNGGFVINISLGNALISGISHFVDHNIIETSNSQISLEINNIVSIEKKEIEDISTYDINGLLIKSNQILSFAAALHGVLQNFNSRTNFDILKNSLKNNFNQSRFYSQFLKFGLLFILGILLMNFLVFNHYFNAVNALQQTSQINQTTKQKILELNGSVNKTQKMVDDMLKSSTSKSSFYVNTIIQGLPNSILLSGLNYQPVMKRIKTEQSIETDNNMILISGESNNSVEFSKWIADLETFDWIKKVEISNYEDTSKSLSNFSLKLTIVDDKQN